MRVHVIRGPKGSALISRFASVHGELAGVWQGSRVIRLGDLADVELDSPSRHHWNSVEIVDRHVPHFEVVDHNSTAIRGVVTDVDRFDVATLQLAETALLLEMEGRVPATVIGSAVRIVVSDLQIYETGV